MRQVEKSGRSVGAATGLVWRTIAAALSIVILAVVPIQAGPVRFSDVIQRLGEFEELRLRDESLQTVQTSTGVKGSTPTTSAGITGQVTADTLLSGVDVSAPQRPAIEVFETGDVEGTICDCGEILIAGGGWPKWPLFFLGAIPLFFLPEDDDGTPTPIPTPPPPNPPPPPDIPEPMSLLLFGSGLVALGAGLRRRNTSKPGRAKTTEKS